MTMIQPPEGEDPQVTPHERTGQNLAPKILEPTPEDVRATASALATAWIGTPKGVEASALRTVGSATMFDAEDEDGNVFSVMVVRSI